MDSVLSISSDNIESCNEVAKYLNAVGIECFTVYNTTAHMGKTENGCNITLPRVTKNQVKETWPLLKQRYKLGCAHIHVPPYFSGCIYDYIRDSSCPAPDFVPKSNLKRKYSM